MPSHRSNPPRPVAGRLACLLNCPLARRIALFLIALCASVLLCAAPARAEGVFIPAPGRVDGVFSPDNRIVYISAGDQVLRYDLTARAFLEPFTLGGRLEGMDLSPNGKTLAVADLSHDPTEGWVHLVNLQTGAAQKLRFDLTRQESGSYAVAYAFDGSLFFTTGFEGSGGTMLRRYIPGQGFTQLVGLHDYSMVSASADRKVMGLANVATDEGGAWGRYDVATGKLMGGGQAIREIAVNRDGSQLFVPLYTGGEAYNAAGAKVGMLGSYSQPLPIGAAYHPTDDRLFTPWSETRELRVVDSRTFQVIDAFDMGDTFQNTGNWAFTNGRTRVSLDGSLVLTTLGSYIGGVRGPEGVRVIMPDAPRTITAISSISPTLPAGNPFTLTATVRLQGGGAATKGTVTFSRRDRWGTVTPLAAVEVDANGVARLPIEIPIDKNAYMATYEGDLDIHGSTTGWLDVEGKPVSTRTELTLTPGRPRAGQPLTAAIAVTKTMPGALGPVKGYVMFRDRMNVYASGNLDATGKVTLTVPAGLPRGRICLYGFYEGSDTMLSSTAEQCLYVAGVEERTVFAAVVAR